MAKSYCNLGKIQPWPTIHLGPTYSLNNRPRLNFTYGTIICHHSLHEQLSSFRYKTNIHFLFIYLFIFIIFHTNWAIVMFLRSPCAYDFNHYSQRANTYVIHEQSLTLVKVISFLFLNKRDQKVRYLRDKKCLVWTWLQYRTTVIFGPLEDVFKSIS